MNDTNLAPKRSFSTMNSSILSNVIGGRSHFPVVPYLPAPGSLNFLVCPSYSLQQMINGHFVGAPSLYFVSICKSVNAIDLIVSLLI